MGWRLSRSFGGFFGKVEAGLVGVISELELQGKLHKRYLLLQRYWVGGGRMGDN